MPQKYSAAKTGNCIFATLPEDFSLFSIFH